MSEASGYSACLTAIVLVTVGSWVLLVGGGPAAADDGVGPDATNDRFEPNDEFSSAANVSTGEYPDLQIVDGESDFFAVDLAAGEELTAAIDFDHAEGDLDLAVYDPDRAQVGASRSTTDDEQVTVTAAEAGTYYVEVYGFEGASAAYSLSLSGPDATATNDRFEPNDGFSAAADVSTGEYRDLRIVDGESDFFAVDLAAGEELTAAIDFDHAEGDLDLTVYDTDRAQIGSSASTTDDEQATVTAAEAGTYYVEVYGFSGASTGYSLSLSTELGSADLEVTGFDAPEEVTAGEEYGVGVRVRNEGSRTFEGTLVYAIDGVSVVEREVLVDPGDTRTIDFEVTVAVGAVDGMATQSILVGNTTLESTSLRVVPPDTSTTTFANDTGTTDRPTTDGPATPAATTGTTGTTGTATTNGSDDACPRGFFTNCGSNPLTGIGETALTVIGIVFSVVSIVYEMTSRGK